MRGRVVFPVFLRAVFVAVTVLLMGRLSLRFGVWRLSLKAIGTTF